jgi:hypothetical protein
VISLQAVLTTSSQAAQRAKEMGEEEESKQLLPELQMLPAVRRRPRQFLVGYALSGFFGVS